MQLLKRLFNPYQHHLETTLNGKPFQVHWTKSAEQALQQRTQPLNVEMQIYFSCTIKKRVLFETPTDNNYTRINDKLLIAIKPVQSTSCDPVEFAKNYPVKKIYQSPAAQKMHARELFIDFQNGKWLGEYSI